MTTDRMNSRQGGRAVLYARVSSVGQAERDTSIPAQLKTLRKHAAAQGWTVAHEYVDEAESARTANRPAFREMIAAAKKKPKPFDVILVWKFSRFARSREDSIVYKSLLARQGVSVVSMNERIDEGAAGKLLEGFIEVIDEFYSSNLAEDTLRGLKENASRGFFNGGSIPVGYRTRSITTGGVAKSRLDPDPSFAPIVKRIFHLAANGEGAKEIAKTLNGSGLRTPRGKPWSVNVIRYILRNENYTGTFVWNRTEKAKGQSARKDNAEVVRMENAHPALVARSLFEKVGKLMDGRRREVIPPRSVGSEYLLSGLIRCGKCGASMQGSPAKNGRYHYYSCRRKAVSGASACDAKLVRREILDDAVVDRLRENVLTEKNLIELVRITNQAVADFRSDAELDLEAVEKQAEDARSRLRKLYSLIEVGKLEADDLGPRIRELRTSVEEYDSRLEGLRQKVGESRPRPLKPEAIKATARDLRALLAKGSLIERASFVRSFVKRVVVNFPNVTVEYTAPLENDRGQPVRDEVLGLERNGSSGRT
jgi:site-specific DNA recombinase